MRSINFLLTYLLTVGLAWHWRCVTDFSGLTTSRLKPHEREMSCSPVEHCTLYLACFLDAVQMPMSFEQFEDVLVSRG